jgi:hypothetical protein
MKRRKNERRSVCPECGGTGQYVGLTVIEACRGCGGTGRMSPPRIDVIKSRVLDHRLFELVLGKQGFLVSAFDSVGNYLHHYDAPPDCIIVGWFFRTLGVEELLADLEERGERVPVIVSTTLALEPDELPSGVFALVADHALGSEEYLQVVKSAIARGRDR